MQTDRFPAPSPDSEGSFVRAWSRNRAAALAVAGLTLACVAAAMLALGRLDKTSLLLAWRVEVVLAAFLVPIASWRAAGRIDALFRAGATADAFGLFVVVVAVATPALTVLRAIAVYLLLLAVILLAVGAFTTLRIARLARWPAAAATGAITLVFGTAGLIPLPGKINVDLAVQDILQLASAQTSWPVTAMIIAAAAGMIWSGGYLLEYHSNSDGP